MFCAYPPKKDELIEIVDQICMANNLEKGWTSKNPPDKEWLIKVISTFWPTHRIFAANQGERPPPKPIDAPASYALNCLNIRRRPRRKFKCGNSSQESDSLLVKRPRMTKEERILEKERKRDVKLIQLLTRAKETMVEGIEGHDSKLLTFTQSDSLAEC